jgi:hypothetical protein
MSDPILAANRYRLKFQAGQANGILDQLTTNALLFPAGVDVRFEVSVFFDANTPYDLSEVVSLSLEVKALANGKRPAANAASLMSRTVTAGSITPTITKTAWDAKTAQHATFTFTDEESNLDLGGEDSKQVWMVMSAVLSGGELVTIAWGLVTVVQDGTGPVLTADAIENSLTVTQAMGTFLKPADVALRHSFQLPGQLVVGQTAWIYLEADQQPFGIVASRLATAPAGAAIQARLLDEAGTEIYATADLVAAGADHGVLLFGAPLQVLTAGSWIRLELTQVGSSTPGDSLGGDLISHARIQ